MSTTLVLFVCAITFSSLHFQITYGRARFLGTQGRFNMLLTCLKLVLSGVASLFNSFPALCGTTLLMSSLLLFVYNIHQQPCMDSTPDGVAANSLRSGVFATCVVTGVFSLVALALNRPQDETLTWIYCGIAPCVFCCAYLVNRPVAVNRKEVRGKSVERDFEALIQQDEATNSVRLDEMAGFFEDKLFARTDPQHFLQLFPCCRRPQKMNFIFVRGWLCKFSFGPEISRKESSHHRGRGQLAGSVFW